MDLFDNGLRNGVAFVEHPAFTLVPRIAKFGGETVPASWDRFDEAVFPVSPERFSEIGDGVTEISFLDERVLPNAADQFRALEQVAPALEQHQ